MLPLYNGGQEALPAPEYWHVKVSCVLAEVKELSITFGENPIRSADAQNSGMTENREKC